MIFFLSFHKQQFSIFGQKWQQYPAAYYANLYLHIITMQFTWWIDWCLTPTFAVFQLYRGINAFPYTHVWFLTIFFI